MWRTQCCVHLASWCYTHNFMPKPPNNPMFSAPAQFPALTRPIMPHLRQHGASATPNNQLIINTLMPPIPQQSWRNTPHPNGALPATSLPACSLWAKNALRSLFRSRCVLLARVWGVGSCASADSCPTSYRQFATGITVYTDNIYRIPHHAPFAAAWGICNAKQSIDNQYTHATHTPTIMRKHTTPQWGIARHIATRMQSMGKAALRYLFRPQCVSLVISCLLLA